MRSSLLSLPLGISSALLLLVLASQACSGESDGGENGSTNAAGGTSAGGTNGGGTNGGGANGGGANGGGSASSGAPGAGAAGVPEGGVNLGDGPDIDAIFANDPPPTTCDGGPSSIPMVGGTPDCPSDKNREGCPCANPGEEAPCWPGYRKNRSRGICKDGVAKCIGFGETGGKWGKCEGYVLPLPNATNAKDRCLCFSGGQWKINNLSPCFLTDPDGKYIGAVSTIEEAPGQSHCPDGANGLVAPKENFSTNTLKVDCAGHFKLCFTLRAGTADTASSNDCIVMQQCIEADYNTPDVAQPFPPLTGWATTTPDQIACAIKFAESGGYGEMEVIGVSAECDVVPQTTFNRITYCSLKCAKDPSLEGCDKCYKGGSGNF